MYVTPSDSSTRYNTCLFYSKKCTQISKHLQRIHKNESRVEALMKLSNASAEKIKLLSDLRWEGNASFNKNQAVNNGEIIVNKRSSKSSTILQMIISHVRFARTLFLKNLYANISVNVLVKLISKESSWPLVD